MGRRLQLLAATALLTVVACTDGERHYEELPPDPTEPAILTEAEEPATDPADGPDDAPDDAVTDVGAPTTEAVGGDDVPEGLLLVLDRHGEDRALATYTPEGTLVTVFETTDGISLWQPIWSPLGDRVAWARAVDAGGWELVTAELDGTGRTTHALAARPDYVTFDPTGRRLLALTPSSTGFDIVIVDGVSGESEAVDNGRPYFSDFAPGGGQLIAHVGNGLRLVDMEGEVTQLPFTSSGHQTPAWHPDGRSVVFSNDAAGSNTLIRVEIASGDTTRLGVFAEFVLFSIAPTGTHVAVSSFGGAAAADPTTALAATDRVGLWVVDLDSGAGVRLSDRPTITPMWDPTGTHLVVRDAVLGSGEWTVYDLDGAVTSTGELDVSESLMPAYLPFWDQFGRSQTVWSPGGDRFVHVGLAADGTSGVWIHDVAGSGESSFVVEGDVAFWSPS